MYKSLLIVGIGFVTLILTQCGSGTSGQQDPSTVLQHPSFANSPAYFNTYAAGVKGDGSGIEFYLETGMLPTDVVLEKVYFRKNAGRLVQSNGTYVARFRTDLGKERDVVMSSDPNEEAANTPPVQAEQFPFPLTSDGAGIRYRKKGVLLYAKISKVEERESVAYPGAPPRDGRR